MLLKHRDLMGESEHFRRSKYSLLQHIFSVK